MYVLCSRARALYIRSYMYHTDKVEHRDSFGVRDRVNSSMSIPRYHLVGPYTFLGSFATPTYHQKTDTRTPDPLWKRH